MVLRTMAGVKNQLPLFWITLVGLAGPLGGGVADRANTLYTSNQNGVPTLMDMGGLAVRADMQGRSLVPPPGVDG